MERDVPVRDDDEPGPRARSARRTPGTSGNARKRRLARSASSGRRGRAPPRPPALVPHAGAAPAERGQPRRVAGLVEVGAVEGDLRPHRRAGLLLGDRGATRGEPGGQARAGRRSSRSVPIASRRTAAGPLRSAPCRAPSSQPTPAGYGRGIAPRGLRCCPSCTALRGLRQAPSARRADLSPMPTRACASCGASSRPRSSSSASRWPWRSSRAWTAWPPPSWPPARSPPRSSGSPSRQVLANAIAGIVLAVTQPLRIGDLVTFEGETGHVEDVSLTYTWLRTGTDARLSSPTSAWPPASCATTRSARRRWRSRSRPGWRPTPTRPRRWRRSRRSRTTRARAHGRVTDDGHPPASRPARPVRRRPSASRARASCAPRSLRALREAGCRGPSRRTLIYPCMGSRCPAASDNAAGAATRAAPARVLFVLLGLVVTGAPSPASPRWGGSSTWPTARPSLDTRKPIDLGATSRVYAADGTPPGLHRRRHPAHAGHPTRSRRRARRDGRHRGPALLRAQGRRLRGHRPRRGQEPRVQEGRPGRLDADDAARAQPLHGRARAQRRRGLQAQDPRGQARRGAREPPSRPPRQALDPRQVPQLGALRHGRRADRGRHPGRRAHLLRQARARLTLREAALLAGLPQAPSDYNPFLDRAPPRPAATTCCSAWPTRATSPRRRPTKTMPRASASSATATTPPSARATSSTTSSRS